MNIAKLEQFLIQNNQPKFRLEQVKKAVFQDGVFAFSEITTLSKELREKMVKEIRLLSFEVEKVLVAGDGPARNASRIGENTEICREVETKKVSTNRKQHSDAGGQSIKALLRLVDGNLIETVLISPKPARLASTSDRRHESRQGIWSACISCQVGCAMGCRFCATGKMGFKRNLTAEEITDQILFWRQWLAPHPHLSGVPDILSLKGRGGTMSNIVFMGMGEPFLNWDNVSQSMKNLIDEKLFGFGSRSLSVSTSGIADGIGKMATDFPQVNLAISLHFANDEKRDRFMPVNKKDNLDSLKKALQKYFQITKRKVFLEYIMLDGINDSALDAKMLSDYIYSIGNTHLLHVNLISYNMTSEDLRPSSKNRTQLFKQELAKHRINATIRKSLGEEIQGACGQLAAR